MAPVFYSHSCTRTQKEPLSLVSSNFASLSFMAAIGAHLFPGPSSLYPCRELSTSLRVSRRTDHRHLSSLSFATRSSAVAEQPSSARDATNANFGENGSFRKEEDKIRGSIPENLTEVGKSLADFFEQSRELIRSDGGPPRWFSPLECGSRHPDSPLLLFLPGFVQILPCSNPDKFCLLSFFSVFEFFL